MLKVHFIIHEYFEGPGAFENWISQNNYTATYSRVYEGEKLPNSIDHFDMLVVLGGPQGLDTTLEECPHFNAKAEMDLINSFITNDKMVIGVCLGAQLIGQALGAKHEKSFQKEIGVFPILMTEEGTTNPKFSKFDTMPIVGHWHNDMPGLTKQSKVLASSEGCSRQIIEYSDLVYGLQCHLEFTSESIKTLIENSQEELSLSKEEQYVLTPKEMQNYNYSEMNNLLFSFLDKLVQEYVKAKNVVIA